MFTLRLEVPTVVYTLPREAAILHDYDVQENGKKMRLFTTAGRKQLTQIWMPNNKILGIENTDDCNVFVSLMSHVQAFPTAD